MVSITNLKFKKEFFYCRNVEDIDSEILPVYLVSVIDYNDGPPNVKAISKKYYEERRKYHNNIFEVNNKDLYFDLESIKEKRIKLLLEKKVEIDKQIKDIENLSI